MLPLLHGECRRRDADVLAFVAVRRLELVKESTQVDQGFPPPPQPSAEPALPSPIALFSRAITRWPATAPARAGTCGMSSMMLVVQADWRL